MRAPSLLAVLALCSFTAWAEESTTVIVVDDDRVECPNADFTSIQAAVVAAAPGDRILVCAGTYHEQVTVPKDGLSLLAKGKPGEVVVDAHGHEAGFLVLSASDVTIEGFHIEGAHEAGVLLMHATFTTIRENFATGAHHDGIELEFSNDNLIEHNVAIDNPAPNACGVNVTATSSRNTVRHNLLVNNEWGIQIAGAAQDNVIFHNESVRNRGNGIRNVGNASGTVIDDNRAFSNGSAPDPVAAGIRLGSGTAIVVARNHAFDNQQFDLRQDGAEATFEDNHCNTSSPPGLCEHQEGKGH